MGRDRYGLDVISPASLGEAMDSQFHTPSPHAPCSMGGQKNGKTVTLLRFLQLLTRTSS